MTDRLLPPIRAEELVPGRLAAQGQRVRRGELKALPTPRTYSAGDNTTRLITTASIDALTLDIYLQPQENIGLMITARMKASNTTTRGAVSVSGLNPFMGLTTFMDVNPISTSYSLYQGYYTAAGMPSSRVGNHAGSFQWVTPTTRYGPIVPGVYPIALQVDRSSGTGTITLDEIGLTVMIV